MSYHCQLHGWTNLQNQCPRCSITYISTNDYTKERENISNNAFSKPTYTELDVISKREFYAAQMLSGLISGYKGPLNTTEMTQLAIGFADALIKELEKTK